MCSSTFDYARKVFLRVVGIVATVYLIESFTNLRVKPPCLLRRFLVSAFQCIESVEHEFVCRPVPTFTQRSFNSSLNFRR